MQAVRCGWRTAFLVLVLGSPCFAADGFSWESDLESAKQTAARTGRLVLVHFSAPWCVPCQQLEQDVFRQPGFGKELTPNFVGVKLNYDDFPATRRQYGVQSIPTDIVLTPDGKLVERLQSPLSGPEYVAAMTRVATVARSGAQPTATAAATPQTASAPTATASGGRYADFYARQQSAQATPTPNPYAQVATAAATSPATMPSAPGQAPTGFVAAPPQANAFASNTAPQQSAGPPPIAPGNAPLALDGMCPVRLCEKHAWNPGDARWGMQHRGRTYLFAGPEELERFRENPDRYSPVMSGNDPVLALDQGQTAPGSRMYGLICGSHYYLFTSEETLKAFAQNPKRYAAEAQQARR